MAYLHKSFGSLITANGGNGGGVSAGTGVRASGGVGGAAVQGVQYLSLSGSNGYDGEWGTSGFDGVGGLGGNGSWSNSAGGRGACYNPAQCPATSAAGSDGAIVITEYNQ
jgi:hypothetical protein